MNFTEKLIRAYKKNFKPGMTDAYIKFKTRNDIAVWSNDPVYTICMITAKDNGVPIALGKYEKEIRQNASKYGLVVYETDPVNHKFTAGIPRNVNVTAAMVIDKDADIDIDYVSNCAVIDFNGLKYYTDTMNNDDLKNYLMHLEEMFGG